MSNIVLLPFKIHKTRLYNHIKNKDDFTGFYINVLLGNDKCRCFNFLYNEKKLILDLCLMITKYL